MLFAIILKVILPYICLALIPIFWGLSDGYRIKDAIKYTKKWHRYKWIVHVLIGILVASFMSIKISIIFAIFYWIVFDIAVNFARELPILTIGTINFLDKYFKTGLQQLVVKLVLLIGSILIPF